MTKKANAAIIPNVDGSFCKRLDGNSFDIDIDFIIRCLFAVSDLGTKFDIDILRKKSNMDKLQKNFEKCCMAIESTIDNVQKHCWISSNKAMGGILNFVPFVYYLFHLPILYYYTLFLSRLIIKKLL